MKNRMRLNVDNLKIAIKSKRIKKSDLALDIGVTRETLSRWLSGKTEYIEEVRLVRMSEVLECDLSWLSPEVRTTAKASAVAPLSGHQIKADDIIRVGLYAGRWNEINILYRHCNHPDVIEDAHANVPLFQILGSLVSLDFSGFDALNFNRNPLQRNHEVFDIIARYTLVDGILDVVAGNLSTAQRNLKKVMIHGQTEWILAFADLMNGVSCVLLGSRDEARAILDKSLNICGSSRDDLTLFAAANMHLMLCLLKVSAQGAAAREHLGEARRIFEATGFRHGHLRCEAYEALLLAHEKDFQKSLQLMGRIEQQVRLLPRLYQTEILLICARASHLRDDRPALTNYMEFADECARNIGVFSLMVKNQWLRLEPDNHRVEQGRDLLKNQLQSNLKEESWKRAQ